MANKLKLNIKGFKEIRRAPGVVADLDRRAKNIADAANAEAGLGDEGYRTSSMQGAERPQGRWRDTVITATEAAMGDNAKHNRLVKKMLDAGRQ